MTANRMVIAGAGVAGHAVADELRDRGFAGEVVIVNGEDETPYDRPPLSKAYLPSEDGQLMPVRATEWAEERGITMLTGSPAKSLDSDSRTVKLGDGTDLNFDGLAICTGVRARRLTWPLTAPGIQVLRTAADARALYSGIRASQRVVIIGAGLLGMELAAAMRRMHLQVTVVSRSSLPLRRVLGTAAGTWLADLHERNGVRMRRGVDTEAIAGGPGDWEVALSSGETVHADLVVCATGSEPNTGWLADSEVTLDDGVLCNEFCETTMGGVVAAGDVARRFDPASGLWERSEHWTSGVEHGRIAARSLLGERTPLTSVPYFWTDQYSAAGRFAGRLGDRENIIESSAERLVIEHVQDDEVCGVFAVNAPRDFLVRRRQLSARLEPAMTSSPTRSLSEAMAGEEA